MKKKKKIFLIIGLIIISLLIVGIIIYVVLKKEDKEEKIEEVAYISYDINSECIDYINSLEDIAYDTILESEYADSLYLYYTAYEASSCDGDVCTADLVANEDDYLVCLENILYVTEDEKIDLKDAIKNNDNVINLLKDKLEEDNLSNVIVKKELDITEPTLTLKSVSIKTSDSYSISSFIESCTDDTDEECTLEYKDEEMGEYKDAGTYDITIIASDSAGNKTEESTTLTIKKASSSSSSSTSKSSSSNNSNSTTTNNETTTTNETENTESSSKTADTESESTSIPTNAELKEQATSILSGNLSTVKSGINTLNGYRSEVDKTALSYDYNLSLIATMRALEMYLTGQYSHTRPDGTNGTSLLDYFGITYYAFGENIAKGYGSLDSAMVGWRNSTTHYENMISDYFTKVGIGYYKGYYATIFAG